MHVWVENQFSWDGIENDTQACMCSGQDQVHAQDNWCGRTGTVRHMLIRQSHMAEVEQFPRADDNHAAFTHPSFTVVHLTHHVLGVANLTGASLPESNGQQLFSHNMADAPPTGTDTHTYTTPK